MGNIVKKSEALARMSATRRIQEAEKNCFDLSVREGGMTISVLKKQGRYRDADYSASNYRNAVETAAKYKRVNRFSNLSAQERYYRKNG